MEEKFLFKMLRKSFLQYGRDLNTDPLGQDDYKKIMKQITEEKSNETEWYEVVEDAVYTYLTNQE